MEIQLKNPKKAETANQGDFILDGDSDLYIIVWDNKEAKYRALNLSSHSIHSELHLSIENLIETIDENYGVKRIIKAKDMQLVEK